MLFLGSSCVDSSEDRLDIEASLGGGGRAPHCGDSWCCRRRKPVTVLRRRHFTVLLYSYCDPDSTHLGKNIQVAIKQYKDESFMHTLLGVAEIPLN